MDGIRAYWDGRALWTRQGVEIEAPDHIKRGLPSDVTLDGELWMGRETFHQLTSALKPNDEEQLHYVWKESVHYYVFDTPSHTGKSHKDRMKLLTTMSFPSQVR